MPRYFADAPSSIEFIFDLEGDAIAKRDVRRPDFSSRPEELVHTIAGTAGVEVPVVVSAQDSAAALDMDLEVYLEG